MSRHQSNSDQSYHSLEQPTFSEKSWWIRLSLIGIATSGLFWGFGVWLSSQKNLEADPQTQLTLQSLEQLTPENTPVADNITEKPPQSSQTQTEAVMGNIVRSSRVSQSQKPNTTVTEQPSSQLQRQPSSVENFPTIILNSAITPSNVLQDSAEVSPNFSSISKGQKEKSISTTASSEKEHTQISQTVSSDELRLPDSKQPEIALRLRDTVILALENNRTIKNQYLERIVQRQDLAVAEDKFVPDFTPEVSVTWRNLDQGGTSNITNGLELSAQLELRIPTGGEFDLGWTGRRENRRGSGLSNDNRNILRQNLELSFRQPLLNGAGVDVNRASVKIARIDETINLLDLKLTLINQITTAILAYRRLLQAQERVKIELNSLEIAQQQVENTQVLIDAGRNARVDLIPVKTRVANQEVSVLTAENNLKQQQLELLEVLDLEQGLNLVASEEVKSVEPQPLDLELIRSQAFENRPDYLKAQLTVERSEFELLVAENERRWNIDLSASLNHDPAPNIIDDRTEFRAGVLLSKTLGDLTLEQRFKRRQINLKQAKNDLDEEIQRIEIAVENGVRDVQSNFRKVQLAERATQLTEEQFKNEEEKVKLGVGRSSIVDLVRFQEDLVRARNEELNTKIDYLNSITTLNQDLGTTLEKWQITLKREQVKNGKESEDNE